MLRRGHPTSPHRVRMHVVDLLEHGRAFLFTNGVAASHRPTLAIRKRSFKTKDVPKDAALNFGNENKTRTNLGAIWLEFRTQWHRVLGMASAIRAFIICGALVCVGVPFLAYALVSPGGTGLVGFLVVLGLIKLFC